MMADMTMASKSDFAAWAAAVSQRTNRSLAGRRITGVRDPLFRLQAAQWGMVDDADPCGRADADAPLDPRRPVGGLFDSRHADGVEAMDAAQAHMPVTAALLDELTRETDLHDVRIAVCLIL